MTSSAEFLRFFPVLPVSPSCIPECLSWAPPPPIHEGGSAPCDPLRRSSPLATASLSSLPFGKKNKFSLHSLAASVSDIACKVTGPRRSADADLLGPLRAPADRFYLVFGRRRPKWAFLQIRARADRPQTALWAMSPRSVTASGPQDAGLPPPQWRQRHLAPLPDFENNHSRSEGDPSTSLGMTRLRSG